MAFAVFAGACVIAQALGLVDLSWLQSIGLIGVGAYCIVYDRRFLATKRLLRRIGKDPDLWIEP